MKIKIFYGVDERDLQNEVNAFINNPNFKINVVDIKIAAAGNRDWFYNTIMVMYNND